MSVENFIGDVLSGNFSNALKRLEDFWAGLPIVFKSFVSSLETDEGKILSNLVGVAVKDVEAAGFTTVSFVTAGKDVLAQLIAQNINTFTIQHVMAALNITSIPLVPSVTAAVPPDAPAA